MRAHRRGAEKVGYGLNASLSRPVWKALSPPISLCSRPTSTAPSSMMRRPPPEFPSSQQDPQRRSWAPTGTAISGRWNSNLVGLQRLEREQIFQRLHFRPAARRSSIPSAIPAKASCAAPSAMSRRTTLMIESGLEGAYNTLDGNSSFISNGARVALPGANPKVNEKRGEAIRPGKLAVLAGLVAGSRARASNFPPLRPRAFPPAVSISSSRACC